MFLVFDFDGTLADTHSAFQDAFDEAAKKLNVQLFRRNDEPYLRTLEASEVLLAHNVIPDQFADFTHLLKLGMEKRHSQITLVPGIADVLGELVKSQGPLGLITSNSDALVRSVLARNIEVFDYVQFDVSMNTKDAALVSAASERSASGHLRYFGR